MTDTDALVGALGVMVLLGSVSSIAVYVLTALGLSRMFGKAGLDGWKAWVPVLNTITFLELGGYRALWVIALLIPGVNIVGAVILCLALNNINRGFGRGVGFTVLGILASPVWVLILGFGEAAWNPSAAGVTPLIGRRPGLASARNPAPGSSAVPGSPVAVPAFVPAAATSTAPPAGASNWDRPAAPTRPPAAAAASWDRPAAGSPSMPSAAPAGFAPVPPVPFSAPVDRPAPVPVAVPAAWASAAPAGPSGVPATPAGPGAGVPAAGPVAWTAPPVFGMQPLPPARPVSEAPQPARSPAQTDPGFDSDPGIEETVISPRRHPVWHLDFSTGGSTALTETVIFLGRAPVRDHTSPTAQLISLSDPARTVSKTHARLENVDGRWFITDLASTNGVYVTSPAGEETEITTGTPTVLEEAFLLGEYGISLRTGA